MNARRLSGGLLALFGAAYPALVYFSIERLPARLFVLLALLVAGLRAAAQWREMSPFVGALLAVVVGQLALLPWEAPWTAKLYPVWMSFSFGAAFAWSLIRPPCLVERLAALRPPPPPPEARPYLRRVTLAWALFLSANGGVAAWTVWRGDDDLWALYNGLISYGLMGTLALGEWLVRQRIQRRLAARVGS